VKMEMSQETIISHLQQLTESMTAIYQVNTLGHAMKMKTQEHSDRMFYEAISELYE